MSPEPPTEEPQEPLSFDRADFEGATPVGMPCAVCGGVARDEYFQFEGRPACGTCREAIDRSVAQAAKPGTFLHAAARAGAVALLCGAVYAAFVGVTHTELALLTLGIGYLVGRSIQGITRGFGTLRYQLLAVLLTYLASTMGYAVPIVRGLRQVQESHQTSPAGPAAPTAEPSPRPSVPPSRAPAGASTEEAPSPARVVLSGVLLLGLCLVAPFLMVSQGLGGVLSLIIIAVALHEAWRRARGVQPVFTGPHKVLHEVPPTHDGP
ncbi:MAG: hypothetical protein HY909_29070 [Deltaproteobacteria bacterium]|nr:hypothetical protein [Deltaproteobacteria bacterium]